MTFIPSPTFYLTTPRLYISHFHAPQHNQFLVDLYNNELYTRHNGKTGIDTPAKAQDHMENWMPGWHERNGYGPYVVSLRFARDIIVEGDDNKSKSSSGNIADDDVLRPGQVPIGTITLMRGHYTVPDCGFALLPAYTGKGYATEAGRRIVQYATDPKLSTPATAATIPLEEGQEEEEEKGGLGLEGVFGFTKSDNVDSKRVCERIGLEFRGVYPLEAFRGESNVVFALPGMSQDLSVYGIKASRTDVE